MDEVTVPFPIDPVKAIESCDKRLWIGNLDTRVNEYQLLKIIRVYGNIEKFDMLFHRSGPNAGKPRGFAFVTYKLKHDAIKAMNSLNGQTLGSKKMCVKFAKNSGQDDMKPRPELGIPALRGPSISGESKVSIKTAIQSIEAKLKLMENMKAGDDFVLDKLAASEASVISQYQTNKYPQPSKSTSQWKRRYRPYHRNR